MFYFALWTSAISMAKPHEPVQSGIQPLKKTTNNEECWRRKIKLTTQQPNQTTNQQKKNTWLYVYVLWACSLFAMLDRLTCARQYNTIQQTFFWKEPIQRQCSCLSFFVWCVVAKKKKLLLLTHLLLLECCTLFWLVHEAIGLYLNLVFWGCSWVEKHVECECCCFSRCYASESPVLVVCVVL